MMVGVTQADRDLHKQLSKKTAVYRHDKGRTSTPHFDDAIRYTNDRMEPPIMTNPSKNEINMAFEGADHTSKPSEAMIEALIERAEPVERLHNARVNLAKLFSQSGKKIADAWVQDVASHILFALIDVEADLQAQSDQRVGWNAIPMHPFADTMPVRDEFRGEQVFLTYSDQSGTWDVETVQSGWDDDLSGVALGNTHWLDITEMFPTHPPVTPPNAFREDNGDKDWGNPVEAPTPDHAGSDAGVLLEALGLLAEHITSEGDPTGQLQDIERKLEAIKGARHG